jgi:antitoxin ParD1/3/4
MAEGINVRISGPLRAFIEHRAGPEGLYANASEYIRDLVRRDFEQEEARRRAWLKEQLRPGMEAGDEEFTAFVADKIIAEARNELKPDAP